MTSAYDRTYKKKLSRVAKGIPDVYLAFRFGAKWTILGATNRVALVKHLDWCILAPLTTKFCERNFEGFAFCVILVLVTLQEQASLLFPRLIKILTGEFMTENLCSINYTDLARSKREALFNIYILLETFTIVQCSGATAMKTGQKKKV